MNPDGAVPAPMVKKLDLHGPMWQWECRICGIMSDVFENPRARDEDVATHHCISVEDMSFPDGTTLKLPTGATFERRKKGWVFIGLPEEL